MLNRLAKACASLSAEHPRWVLLVSALLVASLLVPASRVRYDASSEGWFLESDPAVIAYREFKTEFGSDEFLVAILQTEDANVFRNDCLSSVRRVTGSIERIEHVVRVHSLATLHLVESNGNELAFSPAIPPLPLPPGELDAVRNRVLEDRMATRSVVNRHGDLATIVIDIDPGDDVFQNRQGIVDQVRSVLRSERDAHKFEYRLMGDAVLHERIVGGVHQFLTRHVPATLLMIAAVLWVMFRSRATGLALLVIISALVVTRSAQWFLGWGDNSILTIFPIVVLVTGVADCVHLLDRYFRHRSAGGPCTDAVRQSVEELFKPCLLTTVTTVMGFLAVAASPLFPLRQLGILVSLGVSSAFLFSMISLPAALCLLGIPPRSRSAGGRPGSLLLRLPGLVERRRRVIVLMAAMLTVAGLLGFTRLRVESSFLESFRADDPVRVLAEWVEENGGGLAGIEVMVTAEEEGGLLQPEVLAAMDGLTEVLEQQPVVTGAYSLVDYLKTMNRWMDDGDPDSYRLPGSRDLAAQYLLLLESLSEDGAGAFVDLTRTRGRIWARAVFGMSSEYDDLADAVSVYAKESFPEGVSVQFTGMVFLFKNLHDYIVQSQIRSLGLALVLVTACLGLVFGSVRIALLSLIPNVWPIVLSLGFMGWVGWALQPATAMVAAVTLGIAVDDTVHFLHGYLEARRGGDSPSEATAAMINRAGRAVTATTVILVLGFAVTLFSPLKDTAVFGALCMLALSLALVGDLLILPAILGRDAARPLRVRS